MLPRPVEIQLGEQKQTPEVKPVTNLHQAGEVCQKAEEGLAKNVENLTTVVNIKTESAEEKIDQLQFDGDMSENFTVSNRDSQQWLSRLQTQNGSDNGGTQYLGSSEQSMMSIPGIAQLIPPPVEASCSTFSFSGKPYGEFKNSLISQIPYGSSDTLKAAEAELHGVVGAKLNHHQQKGNRSFQLIRQKKSFVCSYCGKVFERHGHLERHLRIHTGEKPYGCHICGRCFNQKSSLKGHMNTHRKGKRFTSSCNIGQWANL